MNESVKFEDLTPQALQAILKQRDIALTESSMHMEAECVRRCPVDTGHLKGSINFRTSQGGGNRPDGMSGKPVAGDAVIGTNVEYAPHVEYGTKFQRAQPFMRRGAEAALPGIRMIFNRRLGEVDVRSGG